MSVPYVLSAAVDAKSFLAKMNHIQRYAAVHIQNVVESIAKV